MLESYQKSFPGIFPSQGSHISMSIQFLFC